MRKQSSPPHQTSKLKVLDVAALFKSTIEQCNENKILRGHNKKYEADKHNLTNNETNNE